MNPVIFVLLFSLTNFNAFTKGMFLRSGFDYDPDSPNGPSHWEGDCNIGVSQSPINIMFQNVKPEKMSDIITSSAYEMEPPAMYVINNGHTIQLTVDPENQFNISQGPLPKNSKYIFNQLHFHWANQSTKGSEHTITGMSFPMEVHAVHRNFEPSPHENSLAVIGYFFEVTNEDNPAIEKILDALESDSTEGVLIQLNEPFKLREIVRPFNSYLTYSGSLTTPPCTETVQWILPYLNLLSISQNQLDSFRKLSDKTHGMKNNYRPLQNLNDRVIYVKT